MGPLTSTPHASRMEKMLVWLPWHTGSPPFSAEARIQLACLIRQVQGGRLRKLPSSRPRPDLGPEVYDARLRDQANDWVITYRTYLDAIVVVEALRYAPEVERYVWAYLARLRDYEERRPHIEGTWWQVGDVTGFLQLTREQATLVDIRVALAAELLRWRRERLWSHEDLAQALGSSRSRVAKMELPDASVSIDLLVKSLLVLGLSRVRLGVLIGRGAREERASVRAIDEQTEAERDELCREVPTPLPIALARALWQAPEDLRRTLGL
jgi:transcriptional regulator with XRE-family HTH domain